MPLISDRLVDGAKFGRGAQIVFYARGLPTGTVVVQDFSMSGDFT
jgi:hypothetical protein